MEFDAVVVGAGPNGFAAAIEIARAGYSVCLIEARDAVGGGARTAELTLPGYLHDVCSAIHPLAAASPFFRTLPLAEYGVEWIHSPASVAHPFDEGPAAVLYPSIPQTCVSLGTDAGTYAKVFGVLAQNAEQLIPEILGPPLHIPRHPFRLFQFGVHAVQSAQGFIDRHFHGNRARGLFTGIAAHSSMPLDQPLTAAAGLLLGMLGHTGGWPVVRGGSQRLSDALAFYLKQLSGQIITGLHVKSLQQLPTARALIFDLTPQQVVNLISDRLPPAYRRQLKRYQYGPGVCKVDWALSAPIPWKSPECLDAATVHLGGSAEEIIQAEAMVADGRQPERPFVLLAQQSLFDASRAPEHRHTGWAYCHVPNNSDTDMTERIESQVERFAPGFRDCILARHTITAPQFEAYNSNYIGGDISGGVQNVLQTFARPTFRLSPYSMPVPGMFICSSSTPPCGGVHGMCGYHAARAVLSTILYNRASR